MEGWIETIKKKIYRLIKIFKEVFTINPPVVWPEITLHICSLLEILNKCIVFLSEKIYMNTFI